MFDQKYSSAPALLAEAALAAALWDAALAAAQPSSPALSRSPPSPPRLSPASSGRGGSRASSLSCKLLDPEKCFLFIISGGDEDDGFSEAGLVGEKSVGVEMEAEVGCERPRRQWRRFGDKKKMIAVQPR